MSCHSTFIHQRDIVGWWIECAAHIIIFFNLIPNQYLAHLDTMEKYNLQTIGKCQFIQSNSLDRIIQHLSPILRSMLQREEWSLGDREYRDLAAHQIFAHAATIQATILWLDFNKKVNIIEDIISPKFPHLTVLYLGDNNISHLEDLHKLNAPLLSKLFLNNNKICRVKPIIKCTFPSLIEINLNGNYISDQQHLVQAHFPLLEKISLGYKRQAKAAQKINESVWFIKAQIKNNAQIYSPKHKLYPCNRLTYYNNVKQGISKRIQPKDLFKTFQS